MASYDIYTDGACKGNPGKGGFSAIVVLNNKGVVDIIESPCFQLTTNNRMEILGLYTALNYVKNKNISATIHTDSEYCFKTYTQWLDKWGQVTIKSKKNSDLWKLVKGIKEELGDRVEVKWIKAHVGNEYNELADKIAVRASNNLEKIVQDEVYAKHLNKSKANNER